MAEEPKPPYVRFEIRCEEDREATIAAGHFVGRDVIFAIVTPVGTRDVIEKKVEDWLQNLEEGVRQERIPSFWLDAYRRSLDNFKNSRDDPESGTPIKDWPGASPAQIRTMLDINLRTVEELSVANEETVQRIGMGGRALKQKAITWLEGSVEHGKTAEEISALKLENEDLKTRNTELTQRLELLEKTVEALKPKEDA